MSTFLQRLEARCQAADTLLCVGLDPHPQDLPEATPAAAQAFCEALIAQTAPYAAAFKPNAAFFEGLGTGGMEALAAVIAAVPDGIPVILDVKRGDISSTAEAYARAAYDHLGADAVTVNAYMGFDAVKPFADDPARGAFVLCRTSNPTGGELQDLEVGDRRVFEAMADLVDSWDVHGNLGLVVGATRPDELAAVRARAPRAWFLAPGVGAQGADLTEALHAGLRSDGLGVLISVSRGVSRAVDPGAAAASLVADIRAARAAHQATTRLDPLLSGLLTAGCVKFGTFTLKSGLTSPVYLDLRRLVGDPALLAAVARAYGKVLQGLTYDQLAPLPYAAMPIGTAISLHLGQPMVYPRREVKGYGTKATVEGVFEEGQVAVVIDDLATTGGSKIEGIDKLTSVGLKVTDVVVLIDRESGASELMAEAGVRMHAVFTLSELLDRWQAAGAISSAQADEVRAFIAATKPGA